MKLEMGGREATIRITLPVEVWAKLANTAAKRQCDVSDLVAVAITDVVARKSRMSKAEAVRAVQNGMRPRSVADAAGVSEMTVRRWVRAAEK